MTKKLTYLLFSILFLTGLIACDLQDNETSRATQPVDHERLLSDIQYLSSDQLEGRKTGEPGNKLAQDFIEKRFTELRLSSLNNGYRQVFDHTNNRTGEEFTDAVNLIGFIEGTLNSERFIVVTAHYDHLGISEDGEIFNGADDNASGTAGLLAAAAYFSDQKPDHSILFIAFDAEEQGLGGARYFVQNPVVPLEQIALNINMDMISNNFEDELYAVGTAHYPFLKPIVEEVNVSAPIDVLFGYDTDEWPQNWTMSSDHGAFHEAGIPFIYFGVEDHPHYHRPSDTFEHINSEFYIHAVETIIRVVQMMDNQLDLIISASDR